MKIRVFSDEESRQKAYIKEHFRKEVEKRFKTSFIFPIAQFEERFGHLWGHDSTENLSDDQIELKEAFFELRKAILDNGNNQIRSFNLLMNKIKIESMKPQIEMRKES